MKRITISQIENAFLPAKEITDPERFSGRKQYVKDAYLALIADGVNIAIVGNRGIGKSSLARQIINIGSGNNQLLKKLELPSDETLDYLPIYYACGRAAENINILLTKLLTTKNCLLEWIYEIPTATKELNKINGGLDIKIAKIGSAVSEEETKSTALTTHPIDVIFQNVTSDIVKSKIAKNGILIVIDEFDQIAYPSGFASLLKSMATNVPKVKFCIVGVAHDLQN
jgi:Cdc6-like AAA superfamily ATPase